MKKRSGAVAQTQPAGAADGDDELLEFTPDRVAGEPEFVVILGRTRGDFLLAFSRARRRWELPGGSFSPGEKPEQCAARELLEETGYPGEDFRVVGGVVLRSQGRRQSGVLLSCEVREIGPFRPNEEIESLALSRDILVGRANIDNAARAILERVARM